jgi:hypothetical protein
MTMKLRSAGQVACLLVATALMCLPVCNAAALATESHPRHYTLPSDGWKPGQPSMLALLSGHFEARLTPAGACAGLGTTTAIWPAGYKVRFHPTELLDPKGAVVADQGQRLSAAGGIAPATQHGNRCANGKQFQVITSPVERTRGRFP